jgi:hypothetical protein
VAVAVVGKKAGRVEVVVVAADSVVLEAVEVVVGGPVGLVAEAAVKGVVVVRRAVVGAAAVVPAARVVVVAKVVVAKVVAAAVAAPVDRAAVAAVARVVADKVVVAVNEAVKVGVAVAGAEAKVAPVEAVASAKISNAKIYSDALAFPERGRRVYQTAASSPAFTRVY